ncbi:hypothetical protein NCLIV_031600 [Neospora caninum Liverpool]|uniref:WD40 repeat-containing protein n=1 Tax=Neospora caninum (strain Liverpool) TaxID=572307 RepID=F0VI12_NEOCL|nr:hypothetical protein NCLIV_031600 [Neospora caninum Liverpool]CBZ53373.1 hypothetical protein NCLIV_031600 [Neospora caninum Liverpool]CEL67359.1 TPA: WD40 repeat-containing protein [Neospora caninum Liverpool]|eukprot:XP_003883405.1 hypothetical protein NCLIV_031600 [Neospora caninum Liverpool]
MPRVSLPQVMWHSKDDKHSDRVYSVDLQPFLSLQALSRHPSFLTRASSLASPAGEEPAGKPSAVSASPQVTCPAPVSPEKERAPDRERDERERGIAQRSRREERAREKRAATLAAFSRLATAGADEFVHLWKWTFDQAPSAPQRRGVQVTCVARLLGHEREVNCVRWSPCGVFLASGGYDHATCIWELGQKPETVPLGYDSSMLEYDEWWSRVSLYRCIEAVNSLAWAPSGRQLAIGTEDGRLIVVDVVNGVLGSKSARVLEGHANMVQGVAWDPLDTYVVSQSSDQTVRLWGRRGGSAPSLAAGSSSGAAASPAAGSGQGASAGAAAPSASSASGGLKSQWKIEAVLRNARDRDLRERDGTNAAKEEEEEDPEAILNSLNAAADASPPSSLSSSLSSPLASAAPSSAPPAGASPSASSAAAALGPAASGERQRQQGRSLFYPESLIRSFFRRPDWSPDGSILVTPAGLQYLVDASTDSSSSAEACSTTYVFHRKLLTHGTPFLTHRSTAGPSLAVRFNPVAFRPLAFSQARRARAAEGGVDATEESACKALPAEMRATKSWLFSPTLDAAQKLSVLSPGAGAESNAERCKKRRAEGLARERESKSMRDEEDEGGETHDRQDKPETDAAQGDAKPDGAAPSPKSGASGRCSEVAPGAGSCPGASPEAVFPRFVYAVCTLHGSILVYDTQFMAAPLAQLHGLHLAPMTDATWSSDGRVLVASSSDGYLTFVCFEEDELGKPLRPAGFFYHNLWNSNPRTSLSPASLSSGVASVSAGFCGREEGDAATGSPGPRPSSSFADSASAACAKGSSAGPEAQTLGSPAPRRLGIVGNASGKKLVVGNAASALLAQKKEERGG